MTAAGFVYLVTSVSAEPSPMLWELLSEDMRHFLMKKHSEHRR